MGTHAKYTPEHFKNCRFNPTETNILQKFPELQSIFPENMEPPEGLRTFKMARYVISMYDENSPIKKNEQSLDARKIASATISDLDLERDKEIVEMLFERPSDWAVKTITNYLRYFSKGMEYSLMVAYEETFWEFQTRLLQPVTLGDKDKDLIAATSSKTQLAQNAQTMLDMYKTAVSKFYGEDIPVIEVMTKIKRFSPEGVADVSKQN